MNVPFLRSSNSFPPKVAQVLRKKKNTPKFNQLKTKLRESKTKTEATNMVNKRVLIINKLTRQNEDVTTEKIEHLKALTKSDHTSAVADHIKTNFHNINWVCF